MSNRRQRRKWAAARRKHLQRGKVHLLEIQHDAWCGIYKGQPCHCDPVRVLKDDTGRVLARVAGAGFYDPLEFLETGVSA